MITAGIIKTIWLTIGSKGDDMWDYNRIDLAIMKEAAQGDFGYIDVTEEDDQVLKFVETVWRSSGKFVSAHSIDHIVDEVTYQLFEQWDQEGCDPECINYSFLEEGTYRCVYKHREKKGLTMSLMYHLGAWAEEFLEEIRR